jgi:hypothetical protein
MASLAVCMEVMVLPSGSRTVIPGEAAVRLECGAAMVR